MNLQQYNKAFVPLIVTVVLFLLAQVGITENMTVGEVVTLVATSGLVWLIPNKNPNKK